MKHRCPQYKKLCLSSVFCFHFVYRQSIAWLVIILDAVADVTNIQLSILTRRKKTILVLSICLLVMQLRVIFEIPRYSSMRGEIGMKDPANKCLAMSVNLARSTIDIHCKPTHRQNIMPSLDAIVNLLIDNISCRPWTPKDSNLWSNHYI